MAQCCVLSLNYELINVLLFSNWRQTAGHSKEKAVVSLLFYLILLMLCSVFWQSPSHGINLKAKYKLITNYKY